MKPFFLLLLLSPAAYFSQIFEGKISYANSYQCKSPQLKAEQLAEMMGTRQDYYIKGGDYKSVVNGSYIKMQLYNHSSNRSYALTGKSDTLYWENCAIYKDAATKFEIEKGKTTVMGVVCDELIVYTPKSKTYYYYNSKYGVNPALYKQHAYGNWYYMISKTKALPLKTVVETEKFNWTSTAVSITPMKLEAKVFEVPDKNKIAPATW